MKKLFYMQAALVLICSFGIVFSACKKDRSDTGKANEEEIPLASGSGSGGSGSGSDGGGTTTTGLLRSVLSGLASRLVQGRTDSILVTFSQPAPAAGWTLNISSSNPSAAIVPSTFFVAPGSTGIYFRVTGGNISNAVLATITVRLNTEAKSTTIKVFPLVATFPAPQLQSPGNNAEFKNREIVTFTSNTNNNAYYYHLQIAQNTSFDLPITNLLLNDPLWRESAFRGPGTYFWRMRFVAAGGGAGPWSEVRRFVQREEQ
jgi:hypothetical protein